MEKVMHQKSTILFFHLFTEDLELRQAYETPKNHNKHSTRNFNKCMRKIKCNEAET